MRIERLPTRHFVSGREGQRPRAIVLHTTVGSFESAAHWFADPNSSVSAHYLVGLDGRVAQFVEEEDTARHAGRVRDPTWAPAAAGNPNPFTIGIEFEDGGDPEGVERTDAQYAAGGRLLRRVAARWRIPLDRDHVVGHREIFSAKTCPGNLDVDRLLDEARSAFVVCLLPVRNGERDLPEFLETAGGFADAVVALDDGSTDGTREMLEAHPLVATVLSNPPRETYSGWHDAANRQRLLDASGELSPGWVVFLDADERIDAEDAAALRRFLETDALRACAYGLQLFRMWGQEQCDPNLRWVYRVFAYRPGLTLPSDRLHFNPVPEDIPRELWIRTTIRVRHLGASTEARRRAALRKYAEADPTESWPIDHGGLAHAPRTLVAWETRRADEPVLYEPTAIVSRGGGTPAPPRRRVVCLLPVRNGAELLPGYFDSVRAFADAVVALDDGSTDATRDLLRAEPLVELVLENPVRSSYEGWDDAANRQRLLEAVSELDPAWLLFLDADERISSDDAAALRRFVESEARPGFAYGFRVFRMLEDLRSFDRSDLWVYRLFAHEPGQSLPRRRLHLVPVPEDIARERWIPTTLRIQHVGGSNAERRRARYAKYLEADPGGVFQESYENLLTPPGTPKPWEPRAEDLPVLVDPAAFGPDPAGEFDPEAPVLSAIVISHDDQARIERVVGSVTSQQVSEPFEVIVVTSGTDRTAEIVRGRFPQVKVVDLGSRALPGRARNAGLRVARGEYVSFPGSHVELPAGSLEARLRAHELGYPMVTGTTLNGTRTRSGWASYFLDHATVLPGRPSEELRAPPAHCSYARAFLLRVGGFPEDLRAGEDTVVNTRLYAQGYGAFRARDVRLVHHTPCRNPLSLVAHHFVRGRALARLLLGAHEGERTPLAAPAAAPLLDGYVERRLKAVDDCVRRWGDGLQPVYRRVRPLVFVGTVSAWMGARFEIARTRGRQRRAVRAVGG